MSYITGSVAAVPTANKARYAEHVSAVWPLFKSYGATRMVEAWGADVPRGKVTDFQGAVDANEDETVVFSWIEWPDKATADASWQTMQEDPSMAALPEMPLDGSRMIFGGFAPIYGAAAPGRAGYYQGFVLAVPEQNKAAYIDMADEGWKMFRDGGAIGMVECWGEDVPRGKRTDFYRATKAEDGEVPVFSWTVWPDRETCDAVAREMEAGMADFDPSAMPFDGMRMMWAGFEPLFDSADTA